MRRTGRSAISTAQAVIIVVIIIIGGVAVYFGLPSLTPKPTGIVKIGVLEPLTGFAAEEGLELVKGAQLAASEINAKGGVLGMQVQIFQGDEGTGGTQTINAFNQLVHQNNVSYVIGPDFSGDMISIFPYIAQTHTIIISTTVSLDSLFQPVVKNYSNFKWMFRMATTNAQNAESIDTFLINYAHAHTVAYVGEDFIYAHEEINITIANARAAGIQAVTADYFPGSTLDYSSEVSKIASFKPDATVLVMSGSNALTFTQQYKQNPVTKNIPIVETTGSPLEDPTTTANLAKTSPGLLNSIVVNSLFYNMHITNKTQAFENLWVKNFGKNTTLFDDGAAYDAVYLIASAIQQAGGQNKDAVVAALEHITFVGVTGKISFSSSHELNVSPDTRPNPIFEWVNGKAVTFYPSNIADGNYVPPPSS